MVCRWEGEGKGVSLEVVFLLKMAAPPPPHRDENFCLLSGALVLRISLSKNIVPNVRPPQARPAPKPLIPGQIALLDPEQNQGCGRGLSRFNWPPDKP